MSAFLSAALPEIFIATMAIVILMVGIFTGRNANHWCYLLTQFTLLSTILILTLTLGISSREHLDGMFIHDHLSVVLKLLSCILIFSIFCYGKEYIETRGIATTEYYVLGLFGIVGMMVMISAGNLLTLYLGLELLSLSLYSMVAMHLQSDKASEAAIKFFVLGAIASGFLLYGMSLLYGTTGSLNIDVIHKTIVWPIDLNPTIILSLMFILVALLFKLGLAPFHMWLPDVYEGASTATTGYLATAPKLAGFALFLRLLIGSLEDAQIYWQDTLIVASVLSLLIGNLFAIAQTNIKRMLAYSTISHMGFMLFGIIVDGNAGLTAAMFYIIIYVLMSLGVFGAILLLSREGFESDKLDDFKGLSQTNGWLAFLILILMFSFAGIPPTLGFFAKLSVIDVLIDAELLWLAVTAVLFAVIGAFYYLRIIKLMYFDSPAEEVVTAEIRIENKVLLSINCLALLGLLPWIEDILSLCSRTIALL